MRIDYFFQYLMLSSVSIDIHFQGLLFSLPLNFKYVKHLYSTEVSIIYKGIFKILSPFHPFSCLLQLLLRVILSFLTYFLIYSSCVTSCGNKHPGVCVCVCILISLPLTKRLLFCLLFFSPTVR